MGAEVPRAAVVVAHPDDEVLWCGGFILERPAWRWWIATLCRASDPDRGPRFRRVLARLGARGAMGDLDDGPDQLPLSAAVVEATVSALLPSGRFDLVLTHGPLGEYTRHRRHEECCRAVVALWSAGRIDARELRLFAFTDGDRAHLPRAHPDAHEVVRLSEEAWAEKLRLIRETYRFEESSWEARTTPREEGFWHFDDPAAARRQLDALRTSTRGGV